MDPVINKFDDSMQKSPGHPSKATIVANNKTNSDNSKIEQHQHNGLTSGNPNVVVQALAHNKMMTMRGMGVT